jgi:hypothetical protein
MKKAYDTRRLYYVSGVWTSELFDSLRLGEQPVEDNNTSE